jgi:hypothetical protein
LTKRKLHVGVVLALAVLWPVRPAVAQPCAKEARPRPGIVFVVDGIGGVDLLCGSAQLALPLAGVPHELRSFTWSHGVGQLLKDLQDIRHLQRKAAELAAEVTRVKAEAPGRPVYLVGRSAGTALVLFAAEKLPPETLERIVLLSAAVSPDYDLRPALQATRGEIVSFYSERDQLILNWGTRQFGTADRYYGPSAGLRGFTVPKDLKLPEWSPYHRLVQVPWQPRMILEGHTGSHLGTSLPGFLAQEVAPWLKR